MLIYGGIAIILQYYILDVSIFYEKKTGLPLNVLTTIFFFKPTNGHINSILLWPTPDGFIQQSGPPAL